MDTQNIRREIRKIYAFGFFWMFLPVIPILVPYQLSLGMNMQQVFFVQVFFGLVCAAFEVPSGYLSDLWGRKGTLIAGSALWAVGFGYLYFVNDFVGMLIYEGILGIAVSLVSGADVAMLYDWTKKESLEREASTQALANYQFSQVMSEALAGGLCGLLVMASYHYVTLVQALVGFAPVVMACFLKEPEYEKLSRQNHWQNFQLVWRHIFAEDRLLKLIFLNQIVWSLATFVMVWLNQKLWQVQGIPVAIFGLLWALSNLIVGFTGKQASRLEKRYGSAHLLIVLAALPILGFAAMMMAKGWWIVALGFLFPISRGLTQIILRDAINWRTPSHIRATVLSLLSLMFRLGFAVLGPVTGWIMDHQGQNTTLGVLSLVFGLAFVTLMRPLLKEVKAIKQVEA